MISAAKACLVLAVAWVATAELITEDCGDVQHDVENGMIRLPDFSGVRDLNCSWTYTAPTGRKLLVKVDSVHLPPLELRTSQFQLSVDDTFYDIPRNCVKCLREMVAGKVLNVVFTSYVVPLAEYHPNDSSDGLGSFQIRYKAFDPSRCGKPEQIDNGYVVSKGRKVGLGLFYHCNPPYDLVGDSELRCEVTEENPVPTWSGKTPKCVISDCTGEAVIKQGSQGAIATPGYPNYLHHFTAPCVWEVIAQPKQQIKVSISYLKLPKLLDNSFYENASRLSLLDGDLNSWNITESLGSNPLNFTSLTNKLTVQLIIEDNPKSKEDVGLYLEYSVVSTSCPKPAAPENGEVVDISSEIGSTVFFRCNQGYVLVGETIIDCMQNRQWSHPTPSCVQITDNLPAYYAASNDSDTVTDKQAEIPVPPDNFKPPKTERKKATEQRLPKDGNFTETKEKQVVPKENQFSESFPSSPKGVDTSTMNGGKKSEKESGNGPKSEPHLLQVIPPKDGEKKLPKANPSSTSPPEPLPTPDDGLSQQVDFGVFQMSLLTLYIVAGAGIPLILLTIILIVVIIYRRKYPVRMRFGRKFSTFENPMYVTKDAQDPRELKRLTN